MQATVHFLPRTLLRLAALLVAVHLPLSAVVPEDFGYGRLNPNGPRFLVVIVVGFTGKDPLAHPPEYYDSLVFSGNLAPYRSLNAYVLENSNGRFYWKRAGSGLIVLTNVPVPMNSPTDHPAGIASVIQMATQSAFDFAQFDADGDGVVSTSELGIVLISNFGRANGAARWANPQGVNAPYDFPLPNSTNVLRPRVSTAEHQASFNVLAHESCHQLTPHDLYGETFVPNECLNDMLTLMSCETGGTDDPTICHLDAWHKMQLGWSEPRIYSMRDGGVTNIPAAQMLDVNAPIILHDPNVPAHNTNEFFMLEYRTRTSPRGPGYDTNVADTGLALWHVQQDEHHAPVLVPWVNAGTLPAQSSWGFCNKCKGLHFTGNASVGPCPEGGNHVATNNPGYGAVVNYQVVMNIGNAPGQHGWRWCQKCQGMFHGPNQVSSHCPAGGTHDGSTSGDYSFVQDDATTPGQRDWRWCQKCQGMFYGPQQSDSDCPANGRHDGSLSGNYSVLIAGRNWTVWAEGPPITPPRFGRGSSTLWHGGDITPYLRWYDGTQPLVRLYVHPFNPGAGAITVEWWAEYDTWVDFNWPFAGDGSFGFPFNTLADGINDVSYGGLLHIKTSSSSETNHITKRMTIQAYGGPVTLGR